jgi:hypothetical protein
MMNIKMLSAAIGALLLGGTTLANAGPLDDLFHSLPHPEIRADHRNDHSDYLAWHREYRGFDRHETLKRERFHERHHPRFDRHDHGRW